MHAAKFVLSPARPSHCEITVFVERAGQSVQASICLSGFVSLAIRVFFFACFGHSPVWSRFSAIQLRCDCSHAEINVFVFCEVAANHNARIGVCVVDQLWCHCLLLFSRVSRFLFCKSSLPQPFLFLIQDSLYGFPRLFTVTSEHIRLFTF